MYEYMFMTSDIYDCFWRPVYECGCLFM